MNDTVSFQPTPFYFLNDTFEEGEMIRQLNIMQESQIPAFFLHVRDGILDQAYGTALFFERIKFVVEEAAKRNITVWLYDEDSFPSGNAGGQIAIEYPELQACSLKVDKIKAEEMQNGVARRVLGRVRGLYGYAVSKGKNGERSRKISDCFGVVRRTWHRRDMDKTYYCDMQNKLFFPHVRAGTSYAEIMFEARVDEGEEVYVAYLQPVVTDNHYGLQADCLNRRTTEEFIKRTHEKYAESVGKYFGNVIPGIFLDEPSAGGLLPYTAELCKKFQTLWKYDVTDYYYQLSSEYQGDGKKTRREYIQTVTALFCENFITPISEWCKAHGLLLTGHFYGEEDPLSSALCAQSVYRQTKLMGVAGFDIIGRYVGDRDHCALVLGAKIVVSVAVQSGKERILAECFALNPFNYGYDGLRKTGDWLFACGINWLVPHAFHYGYGAYQRADAGKSFFYQDRLYPEYLRFARYAGRVCKLLSEYRQENKVLLVLPSGGFTEEVPFPMCNTGVYPSERATEMQNRCYAVVRYLMERQIGWDVAESFAVQNGYVKDGKLWIENCAYEKVLFVAGGEVEEQAFAQALHAGVDCVFFDGTTFEGFPTEAPIAGERADILAYEKKNERGSLYFLYQNNQRYAEIALPVQSPAWVYDGEKDALYAVETADGYAHLGVRGYGSVILLTGEKPDLPVAGAYRYEREDDRILECEENPQWVYLPPNAEYAITTYDIRVNVRGEEREWKNHAITRLRDLLGSEDSLYASSYVVPYFDTAPRAESAYPCRASYRTVVPYREGCEYLLFDGSTIEGEYRIFWNGEEITPDQMQNERVYDGKNLAFKPKWKKGNNVLEISFEKAGEFDGVSGEIFLLKK